MKVLLSQLFLNIEYRFNMVDAYLASNRGDYIMEAEYKFRAFGMRTQDHRYGDEQMKETKRALTDAELTDIYKEANGIVGKNPPITTQRIFAAMRSIYAIAQAESRAEQREKDARICEGERVEICAEEDHAYNIAIKHCARAIRNQGEQEC